VINKLIAIGLAVALLAIATSGKSVIAQNLTTNASNAAGNMSASANQTGKNMSNAAGNASQSANATMSQLGKNASAGMNKTGESANATLNQLGKNASEAGSTILNKTAEVGKKVVGGAATVLGNISGEIKKGIGAK
jgi:hypothetical protein